MKIAKDQLKLAISELEKHGLLLQSDSSLPNVVSILAGETVKGSWWVHPRAHEIFHGLNALDDRVDVLVTKLISGKVTLVHRKLWRDLLSIAMAREAWQERGLSPAARFLLQSVDQQGILFSNELEWPKRLQPAKIGAATRVLEERLLVHAAEFHTEKGAHAKAVEAWKHWVTRVGFHDELHPATEAKLRLETLIAKLNKDFGGNGRVPWL